MRGLMIKSGNGAVGEEWDVMLDQATDNSFLAVTTGKFIDGRFAIFAKPDLDPHTVRFRRRILDHFIDHRASRGHR
jgi:hypothetical protein